MFGGLTARLCHSYTRPAKHLHSTSGIEHDKQHNNIIRIDKLISPSAAALFITLRSQNISPVDASEASNIGCSRRQPSAIQAALAHERLAHIDNDSGDLGGLVQILSRSPASRAQLEILCDGT